MISLATDSTRLIISKLLKTSTKKLGDVQNRLSTGLKLNCAKDNAANYSISTNLTTKLGAYRVAEDNIKMGLDLIQTATGSLSLIEDKLTRLRSLAVQAKNGTYGSQSIDAINSEANALVEEIERLYNSTEYNGIDLYATGVEKSGFVKAGENGFIKPVEKRDTSAMTTLASVNPSQTISSGTYSISTPEELKKLSDMVSAGHVASGAEFVLANDIDLSCYNDWIPIGTVYSFKSNFDGNGYKISNLNSTSGGVFQRVSYSKISNLGVVDCNIDASNNNYYGLACLIGFTDYSIIENCYATGEITGLNATAGLIGTIQQGGTVVNNCYSEANVNILGTNSGGLIGHCAGLKTEVNISNSYYNGTIKTLSDNRVNVGGFIGIIDVGNTVPIKIKNCYSSGNIIASKSVGGFIGQLNSAEIENCFSDTKIELTYGTGAGFIGYLNSKTATIKNCTSKNVIKGAKEDASSFINKISQNSTLEIENCVYNEEGNPDLAVINDIQGNLKVNNFVSSSSLSKKIQSGIYEYGNIEILPFFKSPSLISLKQLNIKDTSYLSIIDSAINEVSDYQTNLGAAENRLMSALDEVGISYENVLSTRSTLRDADIAKISSEYVQQQILQQASATLMSSTANLRRENILALIQGIR